MLIISSQEPMEMEGWGGGGGGGRGGRPGGAGGIAAGQTILPMVSKIFGISAELGATKKLSASVFSGIEE